MRLATYESESEGKILKRIFRGRTGELENTVFAILDPNGTKPLVRSGRSPDFAFGGFMKNRVAEMVKTMDQIATRYPTKNSYRTDQATLPFIADLRLATNITACDNLPLIVVAGDASQVKEFETVLKPLAWSDTWAGQFSYVRLHDLQSLAEIEGCDQQPGIVFVQPDQFGTEPTCMLQLPATASADEIESAMRQSQQQFESHRKDTRAYHRAGNRKGIHWETAIPVTDPHGKGGPPRGRRP